MTSFFSRLLSIGGSAPKSPYPSQSDPRAAVFADFLADAAKPKAIDPMFESLLDLHLRWEIAPKGTLERLPLTADQREQYDFVATCDAGGQGSTCSIPGPPGPSMSLISPPSCSSPQTGISSRSSRSEPSTAGRRNGPSPGRAKGRRDDPRRRLPPRGRPVARACRSAGRGPFGRLSGLHRRRTQAPLRCRRGADRPRPLRPPAREAGRAGLRISATAGGRRRRPPARPAGFALSSRLRPRPMSPGSSARSRRGSPRLRSSRPAARKAAPNDRAAAPARRAARRRCECPACPDGERHRRHRPEGPEDQIPAQDSTRPGRRSAGSSAAAAIPTSTASPVKPRAPA